MTTTAQYKTRADLRADIGRGLLAVAQGKRDADAFKRWLDRVLVAGEPLTREFVDKTVALARGHESLRAWCNLPAPNAGQPKEESHGEA